MTNRTAERSWLFFARLFLLLEPLSPWLGSLWLKRRLQRLKDKGLLHSYDVKTRRVKKFHYRVDMDLVMTQGQAKDMLNHIVDNIGQEVIPWLKKRRKVVRRSR